MLTVSKRLQLKTTINNMNLQYPYDVLWAEIKDIKEDLIKSRLELVGWFSNQLKMYDRAMGDFDQWYEEYAGDTWEENNKDE